MIFRALLASVILVFCFLFFTSAIYSSDQNEAYHLYQQVMSGKKKLNSLSPEQQRQVIAIHTTLSRSRCDGCSDECREAKEQAESYRSDLESYTKRLYQCLEGNDLTDDCYSEFRRVKSAHSDFESAVSDVNSYCD
jgi:hypothetical protein